MVKRIAKWFGWFFLAVNAVPVVVASWLVLLTLCTGQQPLWIPLRIDAREEERSDTGPHMLQLEVIVPPDADFSYRLRPSSVTVDMESCPVRLVVRRSESSWVAARVSSGANSAQ